MNHSQTEREFDARRRSVKRGCLFGSPTWQTRDSRRLGLEFTLRERGRPKKTEMRCAPNCDTFPASGLAMPKKNEQTKPVRVHRDVAEMAEKLSRIFDESTPDFLSDILRPILEEKRKEAVKALDKDKLWPRPKD